MTTTFQEHIAAASGAINTINESIALLTRYRDSATAEIAKYLRIDAGIELDIDAIQATLTRPYTLLPINEHEAWLIHWRGVKMPIFGRCPGAGIHQSEGHALNGPVDSAAYMDEG